MAVVRLIKTKNMRIRVLLTITQIVLAALLILNFSCSKTEDGDEHCPEGWSGKNCDVQVTPDSVFVIEINVTRFPATNIQGQGWDATSDADIFVQIWKNNEQVWSSSMVHQNVTPDTNYIFIPGTTLALSDPLAQYSIQLYDQDNASEDDYMGGINFISYSDDNGFPELLILDDGGEVAFELSLEYSW